MQTSKKLRVVAAQINPLVGDVLGNTEKIIATALKAKEELAADLVVFPELILTGYPPQDLLLRDDLYEQVKMALTLIKKKVKGIHLAISYPESTKQGRFNKAAVIYNGKIIVEYCKQQLPNYGVFDEKRYFNAGDKPASFTLKNCKIALSICEDLWFAKTMAQAKKTGAQLMLSLNASPFDLKKPLLREQIMAKRASEGKIPIIYVNCVGGQDELVFDGGSMVIDAQGKITQKAKCFEEALLPVDFTVAAKDKKLILQKNECSECSGHSGCKECDSNCDGAVEERAYRALVLGVRDYIEKNHFKGAIISVSGGIDSAITLAIAVDAIGKERVETVYQPSVYNSPLSEKIVREQAKLLDVKLSVIPITPIIKSYQNSLAKEFAALPHNPKDTTEENLQARCRGTIIMAISNKKGLIVLSTGNKSEMAVGYATLYGDMVGGFCVLKDVPKTLVFRLAKYRNHLSQVIPKKAISRPPSAELAKGQKDSDSLPPYPILDEILERYIEQDQSKEKIVAAGFDQKVVEKVIKMVLQNEYKRHQAPPGVRITSKAFGYDRRYPITSGFDKV